MGLMKFRSIFRKQAYVSAFLIQDLIYSTPLLHTVKKSLKDTARQNRSQMQPLFRGDL